MDTAAAATVVVAAGVAVAGEVPAAAMVPVAKWPPVAQEVSEEVVEADAEADAVPHTKIPHPPSLPFCPFLQRNVTPPKNQLNGITTP